MFNLLDDVLLKLAAFWNIWNARVWPGSSKPKHTSTLLRLIDADTGENGSTTIFNMLSVEDGGPQVPVLPFSGGRPAPKDLYGDVSGYLIQKTL